MPDIHDLRFGYADDLTLRPEALVAPLTLSPGSTAELTSGGTDFLTAIFAKHDLDMDQALSPQVGRHDLAGTGAR